MTQISCALRSIHGRPLFGLRQTTSTTASRTSIIAPVQATYDKQTAFDELHIIFSPSPASAPPQRQFTAPHQHQFTATPQHQFTAPPQHQYTAPHQHQFPAPFSRHFTPSIPTGITLQAFSSPISQPSAQDVQAYIFTDSFVTFPHLVDFS